LLDSFQEVIELVDVQVARAIDEQDQITLRGTDGDSEIGVGVAQWQIRVNQPQLLGGVVRRVDDGDVEVAADESVEDGGQIQHRFLANWGHDNGRDARDNTTHCRTTAVKYPERVLSHC